MLKILPIPCLIDQSLCPHAFYPLRQFVFMPLVPTLMMLRRNRKAKCCLRLERSGESAGLDLLIPLADLQYLVSTKTTRTGRRKELTHSSARNRRIVRQRLIPMAQSCLPNIICPILCVPNHTQLPQSHIPNPSSHFSKLKLTRAKGSESLLELLAGSKLLTLGVDTLVVVNKVLLKRKTN